MAQRALSKVLPWLVVVTIVLGGAVSVLFWRDRAQTNARRRERGDQIVALCGEIVDLREGWIQSLAAAGVDLHDPDVVRGIRVLRHRARCKPSEFP